jgi:hypothetical protein
MGAAVRAAATAQGLTIPTSRVMAPAFTKL